MKKFFSILVLIIIALSLDYFFLPKKANPVRNGQIVLQPAKTTDYSTVHTMLAGKKDYPMK